MVTALLLMFMLPGVIVMILSGLVLAASCVCFFQEEGEKRKAEISGILGSAFWLWASSTWVAIMIVIANACNKKVPPTSETLP